MYEEGTPMGRSFFSFVEGGHRSLTEDAKKD